jgi:hypothetical protein
MANDALETAIIATLHADMVNVRALIPNLKIALDTLFTSAAQSVGSGQVIDKAPLNASIQQIQGLNDILNNSSAHVDQWNNYESIKSQYGGH